MPGLDRTQFAAGHDRTPLYTGVVTPTRVERKSNFIHNATSLQLPSTLPGLSVGT